MDLHSLRQSLPTESLFHPRGLRHFQGAVPFQCPRQKQSFIPTCLTGSHGKTGGLSDPSTSAEATNLPSNLTGRCQLRPEAPPARGCPARMSPPCPSPALPTPGAPGPAAPLPSPALPSRRRARPPAATHRPRGAPGRLRPPPRPASQAAPGGQGKARGSPAPRPPQAAGEIRAAPSLPQGPPPGANYLCAEVPGSPPDPPALPAAGDTRPRMRTRAAAQPGLSSVPRRQPPACGIRRIQAPPGKRGAAALRFLSGSSPPGTGSRSQRRVAIFFFPP